MHRIGSLVAALAPLATAVSVSHAQRLPSLTVNHQQSEPLPAITAVWAGQAGQDGGSVGGPIVGGMLLGGVGFIAGALVGAAIQNEPGCTEFCNLEGAFYGAAAGGTSGMALGVHLGNRRRGNLGLDFLTAAGVWGAGFTLFLPLANADNNEAALAVLIALPVVQLGATVAVERATGRSRSRPRELGLSLRRQHQDRLALATSVSF